MTQAIDLIEQVVLHGDLARMSSPARVSYYKQVCETLGLNPFTKPFDFLTLNNRMVLYATKNCTDQLRKIHGVSITKIEQSEVDDIAMAIVYAKDAEGRVDSDTGAVYLGKSVGEDRANKIMKAVTKGKRRVTLSLCGLGMLDESEIESVPDAKPVTVDHTTGEILEDDKPKLAKPSDMVTDSMDRLWVRWCERVAEAHDLGIPTEDVSLPIGRPLLVSMGLKLAGEINRVQAERAQKKNVQIQAGSELANRLAELIAEAAALELDYADYQVVLPANEETVIRAIEKLEDVIMSASAAHQ